MKKPQKESSAVSFDFKQKVFCFRRTSAQRSKVRFSPQFAESASEFKGNLRFISVHELGAERKKQN